MKKITLSLALISFSFSSLASDPIVWNNKGVHTQITLKKGDTVTIKVNARKYITSALNVLVKENIIPNRHFIRENNILVRANIYRNCKKSELKNITL